MYKCFSIVLMSVCCLVFLTGCPEKSDTKEAAEVERIQMESARAVGLPAIPNFQEKRLAKRIYELRDREKLITYTYTVGIDGIPVFLTRSIGFGLPYATQFSNPEKIAYQGSGITLPQAEPNGLFMPSSAEATWIVALGDDGSENIMYCEERVIVTTLLLPSAKYPAGRPGPR